MSDGGGDPVGALPDAYSHQPAELAGELLASGLDDVEVLGIEGPGWPQFTADLDVRRAEALLAGALRAARLCDGQPEIAASSAHLLACGRRRQTPKRSA